LASSVLCKAAISQPPPSFVRIRETAAWRPASGPWGPSSLHRARLGRLALDRLALFPRCKARTVGRCILASPRRVRGFLPWFDCQAGRATVCPWKRPPSSAVLCAFLRHASHQRHQCVSESVVRMSYSRFRQADDAILASERSRRQFHGKSSPRRHGAHGGCTEQAG
jgi:hypothetical protein